MTIIHFLKSIVLYVYHVHFNIKWPLVQLLIKRVLHVDPELLEQLHLLPMFAGCQLLKFFLLFMSFRFCFGFHVFTPTCVHVVIDWLMSSNLSKVGLNFVE